MSPRVPPPLNAVGRAARHLAKEAIFIGTGLAVLTVQELQIRRRGCERARATDVTA